MSRLQLVATMSLALVACAGGNEPVTGDPVRGEVLHRDCLSCHGSELYVPPQRKIVTLAALRDEVERWNDRYNPKMTEREMEDVVAYLNVNFYKFPQ
jgi:mono/diheme cytochrome c family protein